MPSAASEEASLTLDALFRRAVATRPQALALADAENRASLTGSPGHRLTYAEADRMVEALAAQLQAYGLAADSVVAILMPTATEQALTLLAVLRAGLIAAPVPVGWGQRELSAYVQAISARAIITFCRSGSVDTADLARHVAAESFSVRFVLAFGANPPDGVVPVDHVWSEDNATATPVASGEQAAHHVAVLTPEALPQGVVAAARSHAQLISAGLACHGRQKMGPTAVMAGTLSLDALAGLATQWVPWLLSAGGLVLHPPFAAHVFRAALKSDRVTHVVLPAAAAAALIDAEADDHPSLRSVTLVARRGDDAALACRLHLRGADMVPLFVAGENAILPILAVGGGARLPMGDVNIAPAGDQPVVPVTTRLGEAGTLELAGPMVTAWTYPPTQARATDGFVDSGLAVAVDDSVGAFAITGGRGGLVCIGGRAFPEQGLRTLYAQIGGAVAPVINADSVLGQRITGLIGDGRASVGLADKFDQSGLSPLLVPGATRYGGRIPFEDTGPDDKHASLGERVLANIEQEIEKMRSAG